MHVFITMGNAIDIRTLRLERGLSQDKLAERLGVNRSTISRIERGAPVRKSILLLLRQAFGDHADAVDESLGQATTDIDPSLGPREETVNSGGGA